MTRDTPVAWKGVSLERCSSLSRQTDKRSIDRSKKIGQKALFDDAHKTFANSRLGATFKVETGAPNTIMRATGYHQPIDFLQQRYTVLVVQATVNLNRQALHDTPLIHANSVLDKVGL
jgi:hypothetical protein